MTRSAIVQRGSWGKGVVWGGGGGMEGYLGKLAPRLAGRES